MPSLLRVETAHASSLCTVEQSGFAPAIPGVSVPSAAVTARFRTEVSPFGSCVVGGLTLATHRRIRGPRVAAGPIPAAVQGPAFANGNSH